MTRPILASSSMQCKLDTIDEIRTALSSLKGGDDQDFYEEILGSLPQFVACGPQSAGKSSVIRRISGVALPEASTLCTRIATMVQMRRHAESSIRVILLGPGGKMLSDESFDDPTDVQEAVTKAQDKALALRPGDDFVDDHTVQVKVYGNDRPNVTLVDLPGFHTANDDDTKTVNAMIQRYVEMPGTLALHVIKGDQDYGSMLGNDFMRTVPKQDTPRVTVLTHCDKLDPASGEDVHRLRTTLDTTAENSSLTVAVHGRAGEEEQETVKLAHLAGMDSRLDVGAPLLAEHLEERMREHLETQYPKAIAKLQASLAACIARLDVLKVQAPADVLHSMVSTMCKTFVERKRGLMNELREDLSQMTCNIKNFELIPLIQKGRTVEHRDEFSEPFESGQKVWISSKDRSEFFCVIVTDVKDDTISWRKDTSAKVETSAEMSAEVVGSTDTSKEKVRSGETVAVDTIIEDIRLLTADRGMRNFVHIDRQPIIERYAQAFAAHYTKEIRDTALLIGKKLDLVLDTVFSQAIPPIAKPAAAHLRNIMNESVKKSLQDCEDAVLAMKAQNSESDLIFSPNDHYLNDLIQKMVAADKSMASDDGGLRHIYHNVRAYIKVQRKQISEQASKELIRTLVLGTQSRFHELVYSRLSDYDHYVQETSKVTICMCNIFHGKCAVVADFLKTPDCLRTERSGEAQAGSRKGARTGPELRHNVKTPETKVRACLEHAKRLMIHARDLRILRGWQFVGHTLGWMWFRHS